jgi:hypothetical protein
MYLPLNIKGNSNNLFAIKLGNLRKDGIKQAREIPMANEDNQQRRMAVSGPYYV